LFRKKLIPAAILAAIASLSLAGVASADVKRCDVVAVTSPGPTVTTKTATFDVIQPANETGQWTNVWTHHYSVNVEADGTFTGTGTVSGQDANGPRTLNEFITGKLNSDGTMTFTSGRDEHYFIDNYTVTNATTDGTFVNLATSDPAVSWVLETKITAPVITVTTTGGTPTETTTEYKNHGEYVSTMGGGKEVAAACAGMPVQTKKGSQS
jgi:hypothetical protein